MGDIYANNSLKNREQKEKAKVETKTVEKVVKGGVKTKKKSEMSKIAGNIITDDYTSIKDYAIYEVIIPVLKDTVTHLIKGSVDMLFYGEVRSSRPSGGSRGSNASRISYKDYWDDKRDDKRDDRRANTSRFSYDDILFDTKQDAEDVLDRMDEIVEQYGVVTVADLFDLAGVSGSAYTDQNYGWTSTRSAVVERTRRGDYYIKLPRASSIKS